jgi:hypothetical protein
MNWYKKSRIIDRRLGDPYIPDEEEYTFLTGKDPNEQDWVPEASSPLKRYRGREGYNVPIDDIGKLLEMDLNSLIFEIEETLEEIQGILKNPNLSTRSKKLDIGLSKDREKTKEHLKGYISALKKELSYLKNLKRKSISGYEPQSIGSGDVFSAYYENFLNIQRRTEELLRGIFK